MRSTLPDSLLSLLSETLAVRIGLNFPAERWRDLERGLAAAAHDLGVPDAHSCARRLLGQPLTHREIEILASRLTVGETYFFREKQSLDALEHHILPALLRKRETQDRRLRIWSAGCCTGEEPYSIAMLLDRLIPDQDAWNITILATDINPVFLRKAAEAEYGEWSFRGTPEWIRARHFHLLQNGRFRLDDRIRQQVSFSHLNLADDSYPSLTSNTNAMDIILCRNVLMYFSPERAQAVISNFWHSLVEGGWLVVSPAETSNTLFSQFAAIEFPGATLYRKKAMPRFEHPGLSLPQAPRMQAPPLPGPLPPAAVSPPTENASNPAEQDAPGIRARECANRGNLAEAAEWCQKAIAADKLNAGHHYLLSAIQQEQGQTEDAVQSLLRALYLDPGFVLAHYALGNLRRAQGREREARRHFGNALAALQSSSPNEILPESDGLTSGRLAEIITSMQASLPHHDRGT